jgi:membrane fusion protein (multidrug efflux system)
VQGNIVVVTPQVAGTVLAIHADEMGRVEAGQILVTLDASDARNTLSHKSVRLARAVRETRALYLNADTLRSTIAIRQSGVARAQAEFARATDGFKRRQALQASGAVSREELQNARATYDAARSELAAAEASVVAAREELLAQLALTEGVELVRHPAVEEAAVEMREAWLAVKRAEIRAPLAGQVARRQVQLGQRVAAGANLMSIVALDQVWVEANFKEGQLRDIRIGQPVTLTSDLYGPSVRFHGRVAGLGAGTGSAFSLLPAQNASGNWVKIVQRIPVRMTLDPLQLASHPLRLGLSMSVVVDTRNRDGAMLTDAAREPARVSTDVFESLDKGADAAVRQVIRAHLKSALPQQDPRILLDGSSVTR